MTNAFDLDSISRDAYRAYGDKMAWKTRTGAALVHYDEMPPHTIEGWKTFSRFVAERVLELGFRGTDVPSLTRSAYLHYREAAGQKTFSGTPMPFYDALVPELQGAWQAATSAILHKLCGQVK